MIDQNENNPPVEVGATPEQPNQQDPTAHVPSYTQQEYFDAFSSLGINDKEKMSLLTAQGFDPDSSYNMIMDDYNAKREEMLANIERLEKLEEESKKKESTSASGAEGFESGGTDFGEQAFGQEVAVADPRNILQADVDDNLLSAYDFSKRAQQLRDLAREEKDQGRRNEIMAEARELSAQAHVFNRKASDAMNQVFEFNGSDMRINPESDVDADFMIREMARRSFEDDARVRQEFGFLGVENRAELEEFKMLGGDVDNLGRNLDQLREGQWDGSTGLERLWDNAYTTFGAGTTGAAAGLADILGGVFGVDSEDNSIAKYYRNKTAKLNIQNQNSRIKGLETLEIPSEYHNMGVLETAQAAFSDSTALRKFVSVDLPDTIGMVFGEAAIFMGTRGMGRSGMLADRLARSGKIFGKGAEALSIGRSMLSAGAQSLAPTLLSYIPRSYEGFRDRHPDAPQSQALFFGALGGMAEGMMSALMLGMGRGSVAAISRPFNKAGTRAAIQKEVRNAIGKKGGSHFLADMGAEGLEEGFVAYTEQLLNALSDVANGKNPEEVNMHSVLDAAFVGLLGGSGPATLSAAASGMSHSSNMKQAQNRADVTRRLRYAYESETDPKKKAFLRTRYAESLRKLKNVQEKDVALYESLDQNQVDELMGIHQEIAQMSSDLQKGEYINGAKITKEEKDAMKGRLESLFTRKADIEMEAEAKAFRDSVPDSISVPDAGNQEAPAKERTVEKVEKKSHENIPEAPETAPADVQQQEGQLSMFDENTMDDMVQRKKDTKATAEAPTAEAKTTDTEMVSEEAAKDVKEEAKAPEAAQESEVEEDAFELDLAAGQKFDLKDTKIVGEGAGQVPLQVAATVNRMTKSFGKALSASGAKLKAHRTMESFMSLNKGARNQKGYLEVTGEGGEIQGYFDPRTNTIHLNPLSDSMDVMEEIGHLVLSPVIGKNAKAREALYKEMEQIAKGKSRGAKNVKKIIEQTKKDYGNQSLSVQQEEAIISVLVNYANDPSVFSGVENSIIKAINKIAKAFGFKNNIISGKEGLFKLAEKFKKASEGVETEVAVEDAPTAEAPAAEEAPAEEEAIQEKDISTVAKEIASDETLSEEEKRRALEEKTTELLGDTEGISTPEGDALNQAEDISAMEGLMSVRRKQEFDYLKDTEIFYESHPYLGVGQSAVTGGRYSSFRVDRSIKVNDYFHFRNWYNKTTGNQRADRIQNMYFIKDGKKYKVKPPRPRVDETGKPVYMEVPLTPQQKRREESFERQDEAMGVRKQAAEIRDENRKLFRQIPWSGFVNASMFEPEGRTPLETLPSDQDYRMALIAQKNLQAAIEMGLTKEDIQKRLDDSGRSGIIQPLNRVQDGDLVNATGLKLMDNAGDGDNVGMFSVRSQLQLDKAEAPFKAITDSVRSFFGRTEEGSIDEISELVGMMIMGYDRTGKRRRGITSGIVALLGLPDNVLSTHVNVQTARLKLDQLKNRAVAHYLKTGSLEGNLGIGFSILNPEATLGNPDVFIEYMNGIETLIKNGDLAPSDFLSNKSGVGLNATAIPSLRYALSAEANLGNTVASDVLNDIIIRRQDKSYLIMDADLTKEHVLTMIDAVKKHHKNFPDSFSSRKKLFSSNLTHSWLNSLGVEGQTMKFEDRVAKHYNDSTLEGTESATLQAYKAFPYELVVIEPPVKKKNKDGEEVLVGGTYKLKGARVESDPSLGFGGKIVLDTPSKMKHMKRLYRLEDIDPDFRYKETTKEKAQKGEMTPRDIALTANQRSLYEFNQEAQDVDISDTSEEGKFSVRRRGGFRTVRTDQGTWQMRELNGFQRWRNKWLRRLQDKYIDVFQLQEDVEAARGRRSADQDFKMAEELMYGKAAEDLNKLDEKVDKLTELMKEKGFTVQEISDYIYALHAKERNALIAERTEGEETEGSGMSNARADEIIASFQNKQEDVREILDIIRDIQQDTRDTMVKFGLESQETIDAFEAQFENYVPLSGIATDEETSVTSAYPTGGAGMSVHGPTTKRAEGRKSEATNILAQIIAQNSSVHIKARTNEALQALHNLVEDNPNKNVWSILDGKDVNSQDPHIVSVRVNGEQKYIRFKDASYAETLRNMNLPQTGFFVKMLRAPSNWLRRSFTTLNPEFMISNFSRDIQAAMFNAAAEADIEGGLIEGKGIIREMISMVPKTLKVLMRAESPKAMKTLFAENPELERYYQDFKDDGGKTGWSYAKPLDQIASELEKKTSDKNALQEMLGKAENFAEVVEGYNDAFENSIRLSAYIAARKNGVSREKAAQMAKNITVNFNKSGEYGQLLNSVYLFFNASVQGSFRLGKSLLTMKPPTYPDGTQRAFKDRFNNAQKMAAALTVFSGMAAMLALAMSDEDEDGELYYNKIPDYIKERNLIFMRPNGKDYFKIPLPYGFSMFANLGTAAVEVGAGHKEVDTAMMQMVSSFMNSFSPISFGQSKDLFTKAGKSAVPTVFKPLVDVMTNETYFGGPVYTENLPYGLQRPESSLSFRSPESVKSFFRWMNEATGGSVDVKGDLDFNPDKMYYIFEYFIGGAGKFVTRSGEVARGLAAKAEDNDFKIEANDVPFARILYGEPSKYMDMEDYRSRRQEIMQLYKELNNNPRSDKPERYIGVRKLNNILKKLDKNLEALRAAKRRALDIDDYTQRMIRIQEIQDKERKIVMQFNKYYEQIRENKD